MNDSSSKSNNRGELFRVPDPETCNSEPEKDQSKPKHKIRAKDFKPEPSEEFQRFDELVGKLLRSPKVEVKKVDPIQSPKRPKKDREGDSKA